MKAVWALGLLVLPGVATAQAVPVSEDCVACHLSQTEERLVFPATLFENDIHAEVGFGCLACHGGAARDALDPNAGFLSAPRRDRVADMCGRCHSHGAYMRQFDPNMRVDQVSEYWTSRHGTLLREGDEQVATCVDCHPAHEIRPPSDPESTVYPLNVPQMCGRCHSNPEIMGPRGLPSDQVEDHRTSVHGVLLYEEGDVSAPVCNDCHGNHGAAPPGIASVRNVCGQCHSVMADFFDQSDHAERFEDEDLPQCAACHEHHAIDPVDETDLGDRSGQVCSVCHVPNDVAGHSFDAMAVLLDSLAESATHSRELLEEAESMGMEVSQALFELEDVGNARTRARSAIHSFSVETVRAIVEEGFAVTDAAETSAEEAFAEFDFRRLGLGVSAGIILLLVAGLILKMRFDEEQLESVMDAVRTFFARALGHRPPSPEQYRLGACALLLEAAHSSYKLDEEVHEKVRRLVMGQPVPVPDLEELVSVVDRQIEGPLEVGQIAHRLARYATREEIVGLVQEFWRVVYSDETIAHFEIELLMAAAKLLGIPAEEVADMRRAVGTTSKGTGG